MRFILRENKILLISIEEIRKDEKSFLTIRELYQFLIDNFITEAEK